MNFSVYYECVCVQVERECIHCSNDSKVKESGNKSHYGVKQVKYRSKSKKRFLGVLVIYKRNYSKACHAMMYTGSKYLHDI